MAQISDRLKYRLLGLLGLPALRNEMETFLEASASGPVSSTDNAVVRFDGTSGDQTQNSVVTISDTGNVAGVNNLAVGGQFSTVGTSALPAVIKSLAGNSAGLKLYANSATDVASIVNHYNANLEIGTNNIIYQIISNAGSITLGSSGSTQVHAVNGNGLVLQRATLSDAFPLYPGSNTGSLNLLGGGGGVGGNIQLFGESHATLASHTQFYNNNVVSGEIDENAKWTLGVSGTNQDHQVYGGKFGLTSAGAVATRFSIDTTNTAGASAYFDATVGGNSADDAYIHFGVFGVTDWIVGLDNSDSDKFKIHYGTGFGTNDYLVIDSAGLVSLANSTTIRKDTNGVARLQLRNDDAGSSAYSNLKITSDAGDFNIDVNSTAAGDSVSIAADSTFGGGMFLGILGNNSLHLRTNNTNQLSINGSGVVSLASALQFANLDSTARDALSASAGMVIYNTTASKLQVYSGGSWVDLH